MTKTEHILIMARAKECTASEIAKRVDASISLVYKCCEISRIKLPRKRLVRASGVITVRHRLCKRTGNLNPAPIIPVSILRAAHLENETRLQCEVKDGQIVISKENK